MPPVARLLLCLMLRRVIDEGELVQILAADDRVGAHARPAAVQALRADAAEVKALRLDHVGSAIRASAAHRPSPLLLRRLRQHHVRPILR